MGREQRHGLGDIWQKLQLGQAAGRVGDAVAHVGAVEHAVAVEEHGAAHQRSDSHLVCAARSSGCETIRCQISAWNDSAWGVIVSGLTVGTTTQAWATRLV